MRRWRWQQYASWIYAALLGLLIIIPVGLFVWVLIATEVFDIRTIAVVDAEARTAEQIMSTVEEIAGQTPGRSLFLIDPAQVEGKIKQKLPQIRSVYVMRQLPGTLRIVAQEKVTEILLLTGGQYYLVDAEGIAYQEARLDDLPGLVVPTVKSRNPESEVKLGTPVVSAEFIKFVAEVEQELPEIIEAEVVEVNIPSLAAREVTFQASNNWRIHFDIIRAPGRQLKLLQELIETTLTPEEKQSVDYIDLRIPNRIYYKVDSAR
jgi:cell division septal protein FtsQ